MILQVIDVDNNINLCMCLIWIPCKLINFVDAIEAIIMCSFSFSLFACLSLSLLKLSVCGKLPCIESKLVDLCFLNNIRTNFMNMCYRRTYEHIFNSGVIPVKWGKRKKRAHILCWLPTRRIVLISHEL